MNLEILVGRMLEMAIEADIHPAELKVRDLTNNGISDRQLRKFGGLEKIKKAYFPDTEKDLQAVHELKTTASYISELENKAGKFLSLEDKIIEALKKQKKVSIKSYKSKTKVKIDRIVNLVLSDLHIGSDIKKSETGQLDFGRVEEARRLAKITREVIDYKPQYRKETALNLFLLGDIIQNSLHDPRDGAPLAEQVARALHLLAQSIAHLVNNFPKIEVHCAGGNHGRLTSRHPTRAVNQKWDSVETILYYALKEIFKGNKNIKFNIPQTPYVIATVFGKKIFATHGDTVLKPGYPNKSIQVGSLEAQINKINATLPDTEEYSVFIVGHVHCGSITHLSNGSVMMTNGPMVPSDEFAVSIGLMESTCGQHFFESVEGYPVGDCRFIKVGNAEDKDKNLDKIIKPFESL